VTASKRTLAIKLGAVAVSLHELPGMCAHRVSIRPESLLLAVAGTKLTAEGEGDVRQELDRMD
jgi:hypothetical protein